MPIHCKDCRKVLPSLIHIEERCYQCHTKAVQKPLLEENEQLQKRIQDLMAEKATLEKGGLIDEKRM